jgi:nitroreductase
MDCFEAILKRRSVRRFSDEEVSRERIERLIDAGRWAPSAGNLQARDFIVVTNKVVKQKLARAALSQMFVAEAPVVIVVCANVPYSSRIYRGRGEFYAICDACAAVMNILLAAETLGLGACWIGAFDEEEVARLLQIPSEVRPVAIIPVGYPAESPSPPERLSVKRVVHFEVW